VFLKGVHSIPNLGSICVWGTGIAALKNTEELPLVATKGVQQSGCEGLLRAADLEAGPVSHELDA